MASVSDFIGVWRADNVFPYSIHTITWEGRGPGLRGSWVIEAPVAPPDSNAASHQGPTRVEMQVGEPWLEDGVLMFRMNDGPFVSEFRLVGRDEAVVGAATAKLPPELTGPEYQRGIEAHRVRVRRQSANG